MCFIVCRNGNVATFDSSSHESDREREPERETIESNRINNRKQQQQQIWEKDEIWSTQRVQCNKARDSLKSCREMWVNERWMRNVATLPRQELFLFRFRWVHCVFWLWGNAHSVDARVSWFCRFARTHRKKPNAAERVRFFIYFQISCSHFSRSSLLILDAQLNEEEQKPKRGETSTAHTRISVRRFRLSCSHCSFAK